MGYFSQRKRHERENIFMQIMLAVLGVQCLLLFLPAERVPGFIDDFLFQIYIVNLLVLIFSVCKKRIWFSTAFAVFLLINYAHLAASANLFFNQRVIAEHRVLVRDIERRPPEIEGTGMVKLRSGHLNLGHNEPALFYTFEKNLHVFTIVKIDLRQLNASQRQTALKNLGRFIKMQDDPVIVLGDFGIPVWKPVMQKFLADTMLQVKNRLVLSGRRSVFNPLAVPQYYVLAFNNVGVEDIDVKFRHRLREVETVVEFY